jgi:hypothetical protein
MSTRYNVWMPAATINEGPLTDRRDWLPKTSGNFSIPACLLFSTLLFFLSWDLLFVFTLYEHGKWRRQTSATVIVHLLYRLDRSLVATWKALSNSRVLSQILNCSSKSISIYRNFILRIPKTQSPWWLAHNRLFHQYSALAHVIGWRRHVMNRTACIWFDLWTLRQWWRVSKSMHSSAIRRFLEDVDRTNHNSSNILTHSPVRVNVQSQIVQHKINLNDTDRQNQWRDRLIL